MMIGKSKWVIFKPGESKKFSFVKCSNTACTNYIYPGDMCVEHSQGGYGCYDCGVLYPIIWAGPPPDSVKGIPLSKDAPEAEGVKINLISFAYKTGVPKEANYGRTYDVRKKIKNPWKNPKLRKMDGRAFEVKEFVMACKGSMQMIEKIYSQAFYPVYNSNTYIGCQGGKHRSVAVVEILAEMLRNDEEFKGCEITVKHLELEAKSGVGGDTGDTEQSSVQG